MNSTQLHPAARTLARLKRSLQRAGIPQRTVADRAGVTKFMVSHVLAGRAKSERVISTIKQLLAEPEPAGRKG